MNLQTTENFAVVILAAGRASRMKSQKFALKYDADNTFVEKIIQDYFAFGCNEIILVLNNNGTDFLKREKIQLIGKVKVVVNKFVEYERFYSIKMGLSHLSTPIPTFIHNVDNPFVNAEVLNLLVQQKNDEGYTVPTFEHRGGHPILLSTKVINAILVEKKNDLNFREILSRFSKKRIEVSDRKVLTNINTQEDYLAFFR